MVIFSLVLKLLPSPPDTQNRCLADIYPLNLHI